MKIKFLLTIIFLLLLSACITDEPAPLIRPGDQMPWFEVTTTDGRTFTPDILRGHESVIIFFNTSCEDCRRELPLIQQQADDNPDVIYLCIAREESAQTIIPFWQSHDLTLPVAPQHDRSLYNRFATSGIPLILHFSPDNILLYKNIRIMNNE